ncbi:hypothetical protein H311_00422, partial [Anncaliia algerae PRA109]
MNFFFFRAIICADADKPNKSLVIEPIPKGLPDQTLQKTEEEVSLKYTRGDMYDKNGKLLTPEKESLDEHESVSEQKASVSLSESENDAEESHENISDKAPVEELSSGSTFRQRKNWKFKLTDNNDISTEGTDDKTEEVKEPVPQNSEEDIQEFNHFGFAVLSLSAILVLYFGYKFFF